MELSTALLLGILLLALLWKKLSRPKDFPPGPLALPVLGNILQLDFSNPLKNLREFSKVYGPVYSIYLGFTPAVVIREFKDLKEVLVNKGIDFADRPKNRTLEAICDNRDTLVDPHFVIENAVSNIICSTVFGRRYGYDDTTFRDILNVIHEHMKMVTGFWCQLYNAFGFVKHLPLPHQKIFRNFKTVYAFLGKVVEEHRRTRVPGEARDYIDCYLEELDMEHEDGHKSNFDAENLFTCVADLFIAGTETTSTSLEWGLLYMMTYPNIQEKCREEIDKIRGDRDHLDYDDRVKMPYTQAVLQEIHRFASVVSLGIAHAPIKDVQLNGYSIPKGTLIITDLSSTHYDEKYWKYPNEFNPENFLNEDGELVKVEYFLPFSAGPRVCPGENLARMELFLFFTTLMRHFEFHWPDPKSPPDITPVFGITQKPKPFKMRLVPRTSN
ncbi:cytochrome P450 2J6-like isoform X2 [Lithobates pipiens]